MTRPGRAEQFVADEVCTVHVQQRCVRRAWLAGVDATTGKDYSYRREWIRRRMEALASAFAIDVLSYSILSNHLHQILRNRPDVVKQWSDREVAIRWLKVFPGRRIEEQLAAPTDKDVQRLCGNKKRLGQLRRRLSDISWYMRALAEPIARRSNKEDDCTGRFWEGRFKAQRIVDEAGLLACSMYVDLNPVRAALAENPEQAVHTSAYDRIEAERGGQIASAAFDLKPMPSEEFIKKVLSEPPAMLKLQQQRSRLHSTGKRVPRDAWLSPVKLAPDKLASDPQLHSEGLRSSDRGYLSISWQEYKRLLCWTARQATDAVKSKLPDSLRGTLSRVGIEASMWRELVWNWQAYFGRAGCIGRPEAMRKHAQAVDRRWHRGQRAVACCFQDG